jgi:hypothetical protein
VSLPDRTAPDPARWSAAIEDILHDSLAGLEPDPLFRRRLRSDVMNAWVAAREGIGQAPRSPERLARHMGLLGRACLYASVALCASVAGVMAASSQALPGEPLYAVKLRIEELRVEVLPDRFQDELAVNALAERIQEMERLASAGSIARAVALVPPIERQYSVLLDILQGPGSTARSDFLAHRLGVVASLVESLPADLRTIVAGVMPGLPVPVPVVHDREPEPSQSEEPAAPSEPAPTVAPSTATDADPGSEPPSPVGQTDPGRRNDDDDEESAGDDPAGDDPAGDDSNSDDSGDDSDDDDSDDGDSDDGESDDDDSDDDDSEDGGSDDD